MNPTLTDRATKRAFNFNAGPAALPLPVLERIREELLDFAGTGMSVMELSHRSAEFEAVNNKAEEGAAPRDGDSRGLCGALPARRREPAIRDGADEFLCRRENRWT